ncbi:cytochrome c oxidase assembly factor Coa1 family protein [Lysobacter gummosus]|uniref:cytochrome c oxidase assembly factor Coa1 family protein n=1 Tax=Lysobacter gummosus TaxID=262324 RepID=UPI00364495DC
MNDRPNPGWFGRNWKWFVPTGCLTVLLLAALALVGLIGLGIKGASGLFASSEPVRHSVTLAQANPAVVAALGKPLEVGMMIQGSMHTSNDDGHADLSLPLTGPLGKGRLYLKADRAVGRWSYSLIEVAIDGSDQRIDLLGNGGSAPAGAAPTPDTSPQSESNPDSDAEPDSEQPDSEEEPAPRADAEVSATAAASP